MQQGMLWLDTDGQRSLEEKVIRAAAYFEDKYGFPPELCLVNQRMLTEERTIGAIQVRPVRNVLQHHFLLGLDQTRH